MASLIGLDKRPPTGGDRITDNPGRSPTEIVIRSLVSPSQAIVRQIFNIYLETEHRFRAIDLTFTDYPRRLM